MAAISRTAIFKQTNKQINKKKYDIQLELFYVELNPNGTFLCNNTKYINGNAAFIKKKILCSYFIMKICSF